MNCRFVKRPLDEDFQFEIASSPLLNVSAQDPLEFFFLDTEEVYGYAGIPYLDPCQRYPANCGAFLKINLANMSMQQMLTGFRSFGIGQGTADRFSEFGFFSTDATIFIIRLNNLSIVNTISLSRYIPYIPPYFTWHNSVIVDPLHDLAYFLYAFSSVNSTFVLCLSFDTRQIQAFAVLSSPASLGPAVINNNGTEAVVLYAVDNFIDTFRIQKLNLTSLTWTGESIQYHELVAHTDVTSWPGYPEATRALNGTISSHSPTNGNDIVLLLLLFTVRNVRFCY
jgi:hypothetical protein